MNSWYVVCLVLCHSPIAFNLLTLETWNLLFYFGIRLRVTPRVATWEQVSPGNQDTKKQKNTCVHMQFFYLYKLTNSKLTFLQIKYNSNDHRVVTMHINNKKQT